MLSLRRIAGSNTWSVVIARLEFRAALQVQEDPTGLAVGVQYYCMN